MFTDAGPLRRVIRVGSISKKNVVKPTMASVAKYLLTIDELKNENTILKEMKEGQ